MQNRRDVLRLMGLTVAAVVMGACVPQSRLGLIATDTLVLESPKESGSLSPSETATMQPTATAAATATAQATATQQPEATATVAKTEVVTQLIVVDTEIYTIDTANMSEVDGRAFEAAPANYNEGIKAYSSRLKRVVYVDETNSVVGIYNTSEKFIADEDGNYFEGVQPATEFDNVMIVIMRDKDQQFVLVTDYKDRTSIDKEGPEKLSSGIRAALASAHLFQNNKTSMPDKFNEWQTWTRGEGARLFDKDSKATAVMDSKTVKLSDPIIIITGKNGADEMLDKEAKITVDNNGFQFIGFNVGMDSSSPYYKAAISYLTFPRTFPLYTGMTGNTAGPWNRSIEPLVLSSQSK